MQRIYITNIHHQCHKDAFPRTTASIYPSHNFINKPITPMITPTMIPESKLHFCVLLNDRHGNTRTHGSRVWNKAKAMERTESISRGRSSKERARRVTALFEEEIQKLHLKEGERNDNKSMKPIFLRKLDKFERTGIDLKEHFELPNATHYYVKASEEEIENNIKSFRVRRSTGASPLTPIFSMGSTGSVDSIRSRSPNVTPTHPQQPNTRGQKRDNPAICPTLSSSTDGSITMTADQMFNFLTRDIGISKMDACDHVKNFFPQFNTPLTVTPSKRLRSEQTLKSKTRTKIMSSTRPQLSKKLTSFSLTVTDDEGEDNLEDGNDSVDSTDIGKAFDTLSPWLSNINDSCWDDMIRNINLDAQDDAILQSFLNDDIVMNELDDTLCPTPSSTLSQLPKPFPEHLFPEL